MSHHPCSPQETGQDACPYSEPLFGSVGLLLLVIDKDDSPEQEMVSVSVLGSHEGFMHRGD